MEIYNQTNIIPIDKDGVISTIANRTAQYGKINHFLFFSSPYKITKKYFDEIAQLSINKNGLNHNLLRIKTDHNKRFNALTYSVFGDNICSYYGQLSLKFKSYKTNTKLIFVLMVILTSITIAGLKIYLEQGENLLSSSAWITAYRDSILYNFAFSCIYFIAAGVALWKDTSKAYSKTAIRAVQEIINENNYFVLRKELKKIIYDKNCPIFIIIENAEDLLADEIEIIKETLDLNESYKITLMTHSSLAGDTRFKFANLFAPSCYAIRMDAQESKELLENSKEETKNNDHLQEIRTTIKRLNYDNDLSTWNEWTVLGLMAQGAHSHLQEIDANGLRTIIKNNFSYLQEINSALNFTQIDLDSISELIKNIKRISHMEILFDVSNDRYIIDQHTQIQILKHIKSKIKLVSEFFWLFCLLKKEQKNAYTNINCTRLIENINLNPDLNQLKRSKKLIIELAKRLPEIISSSSPDLALSFSKLMLNFIDVLPDDKLSDTLNSLILYANINLDEFNNLAIKSNSIKTNNFIFLFSEITKGKDIENKLFNNNYSLITYKTCNNFYHNILSSSLLNSVVKDRFNSKETDTLKSIDLLYQLHSLSFNTGGFNVATYSIFPILSGMARLGKTERVQELAQKYVIGSREYSTTGEWGQIWCKIVTLCVLAECLKIFKKTSKIGPVSSEQYFETINTYQLDGLVDVSNDLIDTLRIDAKIKKNSNIPTATLSKIDNKFRETIFILTACSLNEVASLLELYFAKFLFAVKNFDSCDKHYKEYQIRCIRSILNYSSPLLLQLHAESYLETIELNAALYSSLSTRDIKELWKHFNYFLKDKPFNKSLARSFINTLQLSNDIEDINFACDINIKLYYTNLSKTPKTPINIFQKTMESICLIYNLFNTGDLDSAKEVLHESMSSINEIPRPDVNDKNFTHYINTKVALLRTALNISGKQKGYCEALKSIICSDDSNALTNKNKIDAITIYFKYIFPDKEFTPIKTIAQIEPSADPYEANSLFSLLYLMTYQYSSKDIDLELNLFTITINLFSQSNYASVEPEKIVTLAEAIIHLFLSHKLNPEDVIDNLNNLISINRKRAIKILLRESIPYWMTKKSFGKIAEAFYSLFHIQLHHDIPEEIHNACNSGTIEEKITNITTLLSTPIHSDQTQLWFRIHLIKQLDMLYRKNPSNTKEGHVEQLWDSVSTDCVEELINQILEMNIAESGLLNLLQQSLDKIITIPSTLNTDQQETRTQQPRIESI